VASSKNSRQNKIFLYNAQFFAGVAQLVEQLICNQPVAGSSPIASSMNLKAFLETEKPFYCLRDTDGALDHNNLQ
jgi:hypothetical protein